MKASLSIIQPFHEPNPPGSGTTGDYFIGTARSYFAPVFDFRQTSPALLTVTFTEGVDFPLQPHRWDNQDVIYEVIFAAAQLRDGHIAGDPAFNVGPAYAIVYSPPPVPDPYPEIYPFPFAGVATRRRFEAWLTGYATQEARSSYLPALPATTYRVPVCEVLDEIQYHLLEVPDFGGSFGSGLWTITEVVNYINLRTYRFLLESGLLQRRTTLAAIAGTPEVDLPTDLIDIKRVAWITQAGAIGELPREDLEQVDAWIPDWETTGASAAPSVYAQAPEPSLQIRLVPVTTQDGTVDLTYVARPPAMTNNCDIFPLPDEWVPYVKYGVLADMWSKEGEANDPERAAYAEQRYGEGVALARLFLGVGDVE